MKANELMVGDYLTFPDVQNDSTCPKLRVIVINEEDVYVSNDGDPVTDLCDPKELAGIPITPEILEKNGFTYCKSDGGFYLPTTISYGNWDVDVILFNVTDEYRNNQLHIGTPDDSITILHLMECNHVHELQHALRICGIENEIVI